MRNLIVSILIGAAAIPFAASAQSVGALQEQIAALLRQLSSLEARLDTAERAMAPTPAQTTSPLPPLTISEERHHVCRMPLRVLRMTMSGDDVRALQGFLITEGLFAEEPTGYFGPITREALQAWQAREGIVSSGNESTTGWGVFGPKSRAHLMQWCAGASAAAIPALRVNPNAGLAPLTVTFATRVSGFRSGIEKYVIDYGDGVVEEVSPCVAPLDACVAPGENTHEYTRGGVFTARLLRTTSQCPTDPACLTESTVALSSVRVSVSDAANCTKELMPVCGLLPQTACATPPCRPAEATYSNRCLMEAAGAAYLYAGTCRPAAADPSEDALCSAWFDGCNTCNRSTPGGAGACTRMACFRDGMTEEPAPYCKAYFELATSTTP